MNAFVDIPPLTRLYLVEPDGSWSLLRWMLDLDGSEQVLVVARDSISETVKWDDGREYIRWTDPEFAGMIADAGRLASVLEMSQLAALLTDDDVEAMIDVLSVLPCRSRRRRGCQCGAWMSVRAERLRGWCA